MGNKTNTPKVGVLLINLGTPDNTKISSIRRYLREFLLDSRVIDLPAFFRYLLVYGAILPFRPFKTAKAYQKIWQKEGSPLRLHTLSLVKNVAATLGEGYHVETAMRYGYPAIADALKNLIRCEKIIVLPLFPQYSSAATGSAIAKTLTEIAKQWNIPQINVINQFYSHPAFINALATVIKPYISSPNTFLLLSYHGLPERHLDKSQCKAPCQRADACPSINQDNYFCYRAQCYQTSHLLAEKLALSSDQYTTAFQSRLGRIPWIKPYTDEVLPSLYKKGIRKLVVACPAFTADCLETLEEIGMQAKEQWLDLGGESFELISCLNDHPQWVDGIVSMIKEVA